MQNANHYFLQKQNYKQQINALRLGIEFSKLNVCDEELRLPSSKEI